MGSNDQFALQKSRTADVRFGSKADIVLGFRHVRFTPESGHSVECSRMSALRPLADVCGSATRPHIRRACGRIHRLDAEMQPRQRTLGALACEATATKVCQSEKFPLRTNGNFWHHEIG
jgi:hypothetical protein